MAPDSADFGSRLRAAREARGMSLKDIAIATKISVLALEALERNDASRLPGGIFSRAFVKAYAQEVGLDPDKTVREFVERFSDGSEMTSVDAPVRRRSSAGDAPGGQSGLRWLGLAVTIGLVVIWIGVDRYFARRTETPPAPTRPAAAQSDLPKAVPPPLPTLEPGKAPPLPEIPPSGAKAPEGQSAATSARPAGAPPTAGAPQVSPAQAAQEPTAPAPAAPKVADANLPLHVVLTPSSPCWVSARVDGNRVVGRTVQPGEKLELSAADTIVLTAGDAAALAYTINNSPGRPLGAAGEVKTIVINTKNYQTFVVRQ